MICKMKVFFLSLYILFIAVAVGYADNGEHGRSELEQNGSVQSFRSITNEESGTTEIISQVSQQRAGVFELDETGQLLWSDTDATGIFEPLDMSDDGSIAATIVYLNNQRLIVYDALEGDVNYEITGVAEPLRVAVAGNASGVCFSTDTHIYFYPPDDATPFWDMDLEYSVIAVEYSRDGFYAIALTNGPQDSLLAWAFDPNLEDPLLWTVTVPQYNSGGWVGADITVDNSRVLVTQRHQLFVLDMEDGSIIWEEPAFNTEGAAKISGDGSVIATCSNSGGRMRAFAWNSDQETYLQLWSYTFTGGSSNWASRVDVSANGETIATGSLQFGGNPYNGFVAVFDTYAGGTPLWISSTMADLVSDIEISDDGLTVAAVSWGPLSTGEQVSDVRVFEKYTQEPFFEYQHVGSPFDIALNPDGTHLMVGGKAVHAREFGNGGQLLFISADLEGGSVSGQVALQGETDHSGVIVEAVDDNRCAITDADGNYQIDHVHAGTVTIRASKLGWSIEDISAVVVPEGGVVDDVDFTLVAVGDPPGMLTATGGGMSSITLQWTSPEEDLLYRQRERLFVTGDDETPVIDAFQTLSINDDAIPSPDHSIDLDELDELEGYRVWRSTLPGGPYNPIAEVDGVTLEYEDSEDVYPTITYYYVVTTMYTEGESIYSNEVFAALDDSYLVYDPVVPEMTQAVTFDGILSEGEWDDAVVVDISDVFGYDEPNAPETAYLYMKYDDENDLMLVACEDFLNTSLDNDEGIGFYVDDDDNDAWTTERSGSEGNYWAYYSSTGNHSLRYRSLSGAPYNGGTNPYHVFEDAQLEFSDASGHMTMEVAIPMGFHELYEMALYGPDKTPGIGCFSILRENGTAIFTGWWPQNMISITSYPDQFADVSVQANLYVPPAPPETITLEREDDDVFITWTNPTVGIDGLPLEGLEGLYLYRNGEIYGTLEPDSDGFLDEDVEYGGWYEYAINGYILEDGTPFEGPLSPYYGIYAGDEPDITMLQYDDGTYESFYVVDFAYDNNKFAIYCDSPDPTQLAYTVDMLVNTAGPIGIGFAEDSGVPGFPGTETAGPFWFETPVTLEFFTLHIPGTEQPVTGNHFYTILYYSPDSPGSPGIGTDTNGESYGRCSWYTNASGWNALTMQNLMVRTGVAMQPDAIEEDTSPAVAYTFNLASPYPNPFNPTTSIPFELEATDEVKLAVYNLLGQQVRLLVSGEQSAGHHIAFWNGLDDSGNEIASGVYFVRLEAGSNIATRKLTFMK